MRMRRPDRVRPVVAVEASASAQGRFRVGATSVCWQAKRVHCRCRARRQPIDGNDVVVAFHMMVVGAESSS